MVAQVLTATMRSALAAYLFVRDEAADPALARMGAPRRWTVLLVRGVGWSVSTILRGLFAAVRTTVALISLVVGLSLVAVTPVVQFVALGYLLDAASRLATTGRIREAFVGLRLAGRLGWTVIGIYLWILPWRLLVDVATDSRLINPDSMATQRLEWAIAILGPVMALHLTLAAVRGGRFTFFLRPIANLRWVFGWLRGRPGDNPAAWSRLLPADWSWRQARVLFWLGVRGFAGAFLWLLVPSILLMAGRHNPLLGIIGGVMMIYILFYLPFLQVHFAVERRFSAFRWRERADIRERFARAPLAHLICFFLTLALVLPLYLLKVELVPADAFWLLAVWFVATIYPLKLLAGWAYGRGSRRPVESWRIVRWFSKLVMLPTAVIYTYLLFLTQYTGWNGGLGLLENHAFLLPVPFY